MHSLNPLLSLVEILMVAPFRTTVVEDTLLHFQHSISKGSSTRSPYDIVTHTFGERNEDE